MSDRESPARAAPEVVEQLFDEGASLAEKLLHENEILRAQIVEREARILRAAGGEDARVPGQLIDVLATLDAQRESASAALATAENENQHLAERCVEVQNEYDTLGNLYVATHHLHSTLDLENLLAILVEVAINLIGADVLAVYSYDETRRKLVARASEGVSLDALPIIEVGTGTIGFAVASGEIHSVDTVSSDDLERPIICIPFRRDREPIGAVAIYRLLRQKSSLTALDHELFTLLAGHAATALYAARLYSESKRKLDTFEGFLDLMRPSTEAGDDDEDEPTTTSVPPSRSTP